MSDLLDHLRRLTAVPAPSGREDALGRIIADDWGRFGEVRADRLGNLAVTVGDGAPHVALVAHLDEVGFVVRRIGERGFVGLTRLGGIPERVLLGQRILLLGRKGPVEGVFATWPHHFTPDAEKYRVPPIGEVVVDVGAACADDARERLGLEVGDFGVYARSWHRSGDVVFANAIDDRMGLAALTATLERVGRPEQGRVSAVASVQEEFSIRALVPTVRRLNPDVLVVVDVSPATDTPGVDVQSDVALGAGPVLNVHSFHGRGTLGGVLPPAWLVAAAERAAREEGIGLQRASAVGVITDGAFALHLHDGIPTIEVGVAARYTHAPVEACSAHDLEQLVAWLVALTRVLPTEVAGA